MSIEQFIEANPSHPRAKEVIKAGEKAMTSLKAAAKYGQLVGALMRDLENGSIALAA